MNCKIGKWKILLYHYLFVFPSYHFQFHILLVQGYYRLWTKTNGIHKFHKLAQMTNKYLETCMKKTNDKFWKRKINQYIVWIIILTWVMRGCLNSVQREDYVKLFLVQIPNVLIFYGSFSTIVMHSLACLMFILSESFAWSLFVIY